MRMKPLLVLLFLLPFMADAQVGMGNGMGGRHGGSLRPFYTGGSVVGRVVDSAGNPVKGATVILQQRDNDPNPNGQTDIKTPAPYYKELTTKKNGKFDFTSLRTFHTYVLAIMADGYHRWEKNIGFSARLRGGAIDTTATSTTLYESPSAQKDLGDVKLVMLHP